MNYCNKVYSNNGILSEGDIEGVRALYGLPTNLKPTSSSYTARLVHSVNKNEDNSSMVKVYLTGDNQSKKDLANDRYIFAFSINRNSKLFNKIVRVDYTRNHESFALKTMTADNSDNNFKVEWNGWGYIPIVVKVYYSEGDQVFYKNLTVGAIILGGLIRL